MLKIFAVYDVTSSMFNTPWFVVHRAQAERAFADLATNPETTISKHPDDFRLVYLGEFSMDSGLLNGCVEFLGFARQYAGASLDVVRKAV